MLKRKSHRIGHKVGAQIRTYSTEGGRVNHFGYVADVSISGIRIVVHGSSVSGVAPGAQARWRVSQDAAAPLEGSAAVVRMADRKSGDSEIILEFDRVRYEIVRSITRHTLFEIELDMIMADASARPGDGRPRQLSAFSDKSHAGRRQRGIRARPR